MLDLSDVEYDSAQFSDAIFAGMGTDLTVEDVRPRMRDGAPKLAPSGEPTYATGVVGQAITCDRLIEVPNPATSTPSKPKVELLADESASGKGGR